jgi:hypothetical protein
MAKKRKTRQEKIILRLKRQLSTKTTPRQEAISKPVEAKIQPEDNFKRTDSSILFYNSGLIKRDLLKTLILTIIIVSLELVLYLKLK